MFAARGNTQIYTKIERFNGETSAVRYVLKYVVYVISVIPFENEKFVNFWRSKRHDDRPYTNCLRAHQANDRGTMASVNTARIRRTLNVSGFFAVGGERGRFFLLITTIHFFTRGKLAAVRRSSTLR